MSRMILGKYRFIQGNPDFYNPIINLKQKCHTVWPLVFTYTALILGLQRIGNLRLVHFIVLLLDNSVMLCLAVYSLSDSLESTFCFILSASISSLFNLIHFISGTSCRRILSLSHFYFVTLCLKPVLCWLGSIVE